jgi:hypothetical protein
MRRVLLIVVAVTVKLAALGRKRGSRHFIYSGREARADIPFGGGLQLRSVGLSYLEAPTRNPIL